MPYPMPIEGECVVHVDDEGSPFWWEVMGRFGPIEDFGVVTLRKDIEGRWIVPDLFRRAFPGFAVRVFDRRA